MADLKKTIDIILNGDDRASKKIGRVNKTMRNLKAGFSGTAKAAAAVGAALAAISTAATALVAKGLKDAYDQSVRLNTAMVDLEKVLGDHPEQLDKAKVAAMELSNQYGISSEKIVNSIAGWVQAGYDIRDATQLAEESIALMYTSELDAAAATTTLTKIMKGFGLEVGEARGKLDAANEISNNYASSVGQLTEAMSRVAPIANAMGLSFEEMSSFLVPAIEKFQNGQRVGTAFAKILNNLVSDTSRVSDGLKTLGVSQRDANGDLRSGKDILYDVAKAFQDISPGQKTFVAQQLAGAEHSAKFLATMNSFDQVGSVYETAISSAGSVTEELQAQLDSSQKQLDRWDKSWENLSATIGDEFRVAATEAVKGGTAIVNALQESVDDDAMEPLFEELRSMFEELGEYLKEVAEALPEAMEQVDWGSFADSIGEVGDAFSGLFDGLDLTAPDDLAQGLQNVVNAGAIWIETFGNMVTALGKLGEGLTKGAQLANDFFDILQEIDGPVDFFATGIGLIVGAIQGLYEAMDKVPGMDLVFNTKESIAALESIGTALAGMTLEAEKSGGKLEEMKGHLDEIPGGKNVNVDVDDGGTAQGTQQKIKDILPEGYNVGVRIEEDDSVEEIRQKLKKLDEDKNVDVEVDDQGTAEGTKEKVDQIPDKKKLELQTEIKEQQLEKDIARIETRGELAKKAFKYKADVDIADIEAGAEKMKALAENAAKSFKSTGDVIGNLMGSYTDVGDTFQEYHIESWIEREQKRRDELLDTQKDLTQAEIDYTRAKTDALQSGDGQIQIEAAGLEPELEAFMWRIIERVQIRANEEAGEFLLGVG